MAWIRLTSLAGTGGGGGRQLARRNGGMVGVASSDGEGIALMPPAVYGTAVVGATELGLGMSAENEVGADAESDSRGMPVRDVGSPPGKGGGGGGGGGLTGASQLRGLTV